MFPFFEILGRTVGMYGLCAILGLLACATVCTVLSKRYRLALEDMVMVTLCAGIGILLGGHLLYGLINLPRLISYIRAADGFSFSSLPSALATVFGGSVFYGGFLGSVLAVSVYGGHKKRRPLYLDLLAVATPLFHTFGRIGCFLGGCCYGIESRFGFTAHGNPYVPQINGVSRFPVQLLEAGLNLLIFLLLARLFKKEKLSGKLIFIYILTYAPIRFCLEFLRGDAARGLFLWFSSSQWISLLLFPIALITLCLSLRRSAVKQ